MKRGIYKGLAIGLILTLMLSIPVHATADPDSTSIITKGVYRNLLETGDNLIIAEYDIAYASPPTPDVDKTFIFKFTSPDGATVYGLNTAYPYANGGYGKGIISFYFSAANVTSLGITWEAANIIRITENPAQFTTPVSYDFPLASGDYTSATSQSDNELALRVNLVEIANGLQTAWGVTNLITSNDTGNVLNTAGEYYFCFSITGLRSLCPSIFYSQITDPAYSSTTWATTQADAYANRFNGTFVADALNATGTLLGKDATFAACLIMLVLSGVAVFLSVKYTGDASGGYPCSVLILNVGACCLPGVIYIVAIVCLLCFIYIGISVGRQFT